MRNICIDRLCMRLAANEGKACILVVRDAAWIQLTVDKWYEEIQYKFIN